MEREPRFAAGKVALQWQTRSLLIEMNHAYILVKFSVFFIPKMHDSQPFSLILR